MDADDCWAIIRPACEVVEDPVNTVNTMLNWSTDPMGSLFRAMQEGAAGISGELFPIMLKLTSPDLTADWWLMSYAISFGAAVLVMAVLILKQIAQAAQAKDTAVAGSEVFQTLFVYTPVFLLCAMFGPVAGLLVNQLVNLATEGLAAWAMGGSYDSFSATITNQVGGLDTEVLTGGVFMGIILMLGYWASFLMLFFVLLVQLVSLYLLGVIVPLGLVMMLNPRNRAAGGKLAMAWLMLMLVRPLVVFLLGVTFHAVAAFGGDSIDAFTGAGDPSTGFASLISAAVSIIMMLIVCFSPFLLMRYAPVLGQAASAPSSGGSSGSIGARSLHDVSSARSASQRAQAKSGGGGGRSAPASSGGGASQGAAAQGGQTVAPRVASGASAGAGKAAAASGGKAAGAAAAGGKAAAGAKVAGTAAAGAGATAATGGAAAGVAAVAIGAEVVKAGTRRARREAQQAAELDTRVIGEEKQS